MSTRRERAEVKVAKGTWIWEEGGKLVALPPEPEGRRLVEDEEWIMASYDALPLIVSNRPLPLRWPEFPEGGSLKEIAEWNKACDKVDKQAADDPVTYPPILRETKDDLDTSTSDLFSATSDHREKILGLARCIVSISSTRGDGSLNWRFNGIIIGPSVVHERIRILTTSETVCDCEGILDHKLHVRLPNKDIKEAEVLCFDDYYGLAILGISGAMPSDISGGMPLWSPTFVSYPDYGDGVFVLTRNQHSSLITTKGKVLWHNESYFGRNYYLYLSCDLPKRISGALVMDRDGNICGMTFDCGSPKTAVLPSFIIRNLIEMFSKFRCIVHPAHGLSLRAVELLGMSRREDIFYKHNIRSGYLVDEVEMDSTAETIGIRRGDVIVSVNGMHFQNVLETRRHRLARVRETPALLQADCLCTVICNLKNTDDGDLVTGPAGAQQRDPTATKTTVVDWRHFLNQDFAMYAIADDGLWEPSEHIHFFKDDTLIPYDVSSCHLIFIPIYEVAHFALYAFDMKNKIVNILDPVRDASMGGEDIKLRHNTTKTKVAKALNECLKLAYPEWNEHIQNWEDKYPTSILPECQKVDSAFHVINYMRNWDGARLVNPVPLESLNLRKEFLFNLLSFTSNEAILPEPVERIIKLSSRRK